MAKSKLRFNHAQKVINVYVEDYLSLDKSDKETIKKLEEINYKVELEDKPRKKSTYKPQSLKHADIMRLLEGSKLEKVKAEYLKRCNISADGKMKSFMKGLAYINKVNKAINECKENNVAISDEWLYKNVK